MKSYIVSYDLNNSGKNYEDLISKIKTYSRWAHVNESVWFLKSDKGCVAIRDELLAQIDNDDSLFVAELTGVAAWHNVICKSQYLKDYL
ncbi:CRISPR-associated protein Cas2 [Enterococcus hirae]|uniref:CRISPR-associated protein Cas2 n=1 Tax=Enterococcus hirae TaxID=1354 RepID=UPI001A97159F|nr:CRISPR-associated protein Cas2 [Enterococcus hirae]MBO1087805.1 CRISPR-associated protein Cas2 [Enterococcus hirae]